MSYEIPVATIRKLLLPILILTYCGLFQNTGSYHVGARIECIRQELELFDGCDLLRQFNDSQQLASVECP